MLAVSRNLVAQPYAHRVPCLATGRGAPTGEGAPRPPIGRSAQAARPATLPHVVVDLPAKLSVEKATRDRSTHHVMEQNEKRLIDGEARPGDGLGHGRSNTNQLQATVSK